MPEGGFADGALSDAQRRPSARTRPLGTKRGCGKLAVVAPESPRIAELRRRLEQDPASIAFAQLAEEYRRAGAYREAVKYCRSGLARHPGYLSARVTLGRALMELGDLDDAAREMSLVLESAPDNLSALQAMADVHERRGSLTDALTYYKRALTIARFDPRIEASVTRIDRELGGAPEVAEPPVHQFPPARSLMDFDALLTSLGAPDASPPPLMNHLLTGAGARRRPRATSPVKRCTLATRKTRSPGSNRSFARSASARFGRTTRCSRSWKAGCGHSPRTAVGHGAAREGCAG